jgi:tRNA A-37 threonylcarbamoyl transferase component Bud32
VTARRPSRPERLLDEADRAQRGGDFAAAAVALRTHLDEHPDDERSRLRFATVLITLGEGGRARALLAPMEAGSDDDGIRREAIRRLAELDEAEGAVIAAAERWEKIIADDIDDPQARSHLTVLRPARSDVDVQPSQTLVSPAGIETLRFRLLRELGRGATATVYLARDEALGLHIALKVLHPQLSGSGRSDSLRRFFADARVAAAVRHPGVVAIYDVDEAARAVAMEWIPGGTLRQRLREHPAGLPAPELRATLRSLLGALAHVHAAGIVHGDLKPSNLLLRAPGDVVLADFGAAELTGGAGSARRANGGVAGTPLYFAPEQFQGAGSSTDADLYAVGAILWEAATGRPLRSHADLMRGSGAVQPLSEDDGAKIEAAHGPELLRLLVLFLGDVPARRLALLVADRLLGGGPEVDL